MPDRLKTLVELVVLSALILAFSSAGVSAMGLSLKANWTDGSMPELADLNNDNTSEIISPFVNSVYVWYGNGTAFGDWPKDTLYPVQSYPAIGDINNDSEKEIVFGNMNGILYSYYKNGTEIWNNADCLNSWGGSIDSSPVLTDIDGDGNVDILVLCKPWGDSIIYAFDNQGNIIWSSGPTSRDAAGSPAVSDLDDDGKPEIVVMGGVYGPFYVQALYAANGTPCWSDYPPDGIVYPDGEFSGQMPSATESPVIGDVDGDNENEIVVASSDGTTSNVYIISKNGSLENSWQVPSLGLPSPIVLANLTLDSYPEIIIYWNDTIYVGNGTGLIWSQTIGDVWSPSLSAPAPAAGDIDGDSVPEVLVPAGKNLLIFSNTGSLLLNKSFDHSLSTPAIGDVDSDGKKEIVIGTEGNKIYVFDVVDTEGPNLVLYAPQNTTYSSLTGIPLNYSVSDALSGVDSAWYSLDGVENITLSGNTTFSVSSYGSHNITLYANDTAGNENSSTIVFTVLCSESWSCSDWSACSGEAQTRACADANSCGTASARPAESQSCVVISGGGGGMFRPPVQLPSVSYSWDRISDKASMSLDNREIAVYSILMEMESPASRVYVKVARLPEKPNGTGDLAGEAYQYLQIEHENLAGSMNRSVIRFAINRSWIIENDINASSIALKRYSNDSWEDLPTRLINESGESLYYEAETPGFSYFAITGSRNHVLPSGLPACGDGNCGPGESCSSCAKDCGICRIQMPANESGAAGNATNQAQITGQAIISPIDGLLVGLVVLLGIVAIIAFKK